VAFGELIDGVELVSGVAVVVGVLVASRPPRDAPSPDNVQISGESAGLSETAAQPSGIQ
jgi:hypothetical protein